MFNGHKLSGSCSNQSQPKIFLLRILPSYPSSALTVENLKRLEEEYEASKEAFKMQSMQDSIEQTNLALFNEETTRGTSRDFVCDAEPEGASSPLPAKQGKTAIKFPERLLKKEEILTAPATYSLSAQPTGPVPKKSRLLFQLRKKNRSDSPAAVNQHNTTFPTTDAVQQHGFTPSGDMDPSSHLPDYQIPGRGEKCHLVLGVSLETVGISAIWEPVKLAQGNPSPESDKEPLSMGGEHKDDGTVRTALCPGKGHPGPTSWHLLGAGRGHQKRRSALTTVSTHGPPFQSITMKQKGHITAEASGERIQAVFWCRHRLNVASSHSNALLKDPEKSHPLRWPESEEELLLQSENIQLMSLLSNNQCCNTFGNLFLVDITPWILLSSARMKY
ncbi:uncharacterized protein [Chamaea fasciata]|uniref:uncharacterized protein n=1 Tax=Chamaea fasciata TaxID=190680 RepID=UPI00336A82E3